jgi:hypothetical protein
VIQLTTLKGWPNGIALAKCLHSLAGLRGVRAA